MSKSKTVAGMTRGQCARDAANRAMLDGKAPTYVDHWLDWFDKTPCSQLPEKSDKACEGCVDKKKCEAAQCHSAQ